MSKKKRVLDQAEKNLRRVLKARAKDLVRDMVSRHLITDTQTALFEKSLALILQTAFDERHPHLQAIEMMPVVPTHQMGVGTVIARGHTHAGEATVTSSYDTEISQVQIQGREHAMIVQGFITSYFLAYQMIMEAAFAGVQLDQGLARAAYRVVDEGIDLCLSLGHASGGVTGMLNNAGITRWRGGVTGTTVGSWADSGTTDVQIIADLELMIDEVQSMSRFRPTDLAIGPLEYNRLLRPQAAADYSPSLLAVFEQAYGLKISKWERLRAIPASVAAGPSAVASSVLYERSQDVFYPHLSAGPEQYPPKVELAGYRVGVHRRCGGVEVANPDGAIYFDMS